MPELISSMKNLVVFQVQSVSGKRSYNFVVLIHAAKVKRIFEMEKCWGNFFQKKITPDSLTEVRDYQKLNILKNRPDSLTNQRLPGINAANIPKLFYICNFFSTFFHKD